MGQRDRLKGIADAIRDAKGTTEKIKASNFATEISNVFQAGEKSEYDRFWDSFQDYGNLTVYSGVFVRCWTAKNFKPKYDIKATGAYYFNEIGTNDLLVKYGQVIMKDLEEQQGITFDFSKAPNLSKAFSGGLFKELNVIDLKSCISCAQIFSDSAFAGASWESLRKTRIERLICYEQTKFELSSFQACSSMEYIGFDGVLAQNGLDLHWSIKLSKESILKLVNILSTTTSGLSVTLSKTAVNREFETSTGANDGSTSTEWTTLIATKSNWTITLA